MRHSPRSMYDFSWARHAQAANGFGDAAFALERTQRLSHCPSAIPSAYRPRPWMAWLTRAVRAIADAARASAAARRQRRLARETFFTLQALDGRTLRDLGFDRSEIASVACEVAGLADATRAHPERFPNSR